VKAALNVTFAQHSEVASLDYVRIGSVELLATDEDKAKYPSHWRAYRLGLPLEPEPGVPHFFRKDLPRTIETIEIRFPGDAGQVLKRELRPSDLVEFKAEYEAWRNGTRVGTPFASLTEAEYQELELNSDLVKELAAGAVDTVEHLAELPDPAVRRLMGGLSLRKRAQAFLARRAAEAIPPKIQAALDALAARLVALEQRNGDTTP
jgi:hypothetical protein